MTDIILSNARLIDPETGFDAPGALLIRDGMIADIAQGAVPDAPEGAEIVDCGGHPLAPGIVDMRVFVGEPGERHKESFRTAGQAAAAGGVTTMVTRPDTEPCIDNPETLEFVTRRAQADSPVRVLPMAALTKARDGNEMTEIGFLLDAGIRRPLPQRDERAFLRKHLKIIFVHTEI